MTLGNTTGYRRQAVEELAKFRMEWDEHVNGESLVGVSASVGLMLSDIADRLGMTPAERILFLGQILSGDLQDFLTQQDELE